MKKVLLRTMIVCFGVSSAITLSAQPTWTQSLNAVFSYHMATLDNGYVFGNYANTLKKSPNGAPGSFTSVSNFPVTSVSDYVTMVGNGNTLLVGTYNYNYSAHGIFATTDNGATWTRRNNGLGGDTCVPMIAVMANGVVIANTTNGVTNKIYRSTDNGLNWTYIQTISGSLQGLAVRSATEAYMNGGYDVYKSTNNGLTWTSISTTSLNDIMILSSGTFYATTYNSIQKSVDNGVTWTAVTTTGLPASFQCGAFIKAPGDTVYFADIASPYGLYYSVNGCLNWNACMTGLPASPYIMRHDMAIDANGYMFCSPSGGGIYRTTAPITHSTVGITESLASVVFSIYPNPTADIVKISSGMSGTNRYVLYDVTGTALFSAELSAGNAEIDLSTYPVGCYFLEISNETGTVIKKILRN